MLRPRRMTRVLVAGSKKHMRRAVEALYLVRSLHIADYAEQHEGFRLGTPMEGAATLSENLLRLHAGAKTLGIRGDETLGQARPGSWARDRLDGLLEALEREVAAREKARQDMDGYLKVLEKRRESYELFTQLPLPYEAYTPYGSLEVITGTAGSPFEEELKAITPRYELYWTRPGGMLALFVEKAAAPGVDKLLARHDFTPVRVPFHKGMPAAVLAGLEGEMAAHRQKLQKLGEEIAAARARYRDELLACTEELAIEIEKAEAPLRFATTDSSFVMEGWIPTEELEKVENALLKATDNRVWMDRLEEKEWLAECAEPSKVEKGAGRPEEGQTAVPGPGGGHSGDGGGEDAYGCVPVALSHAGPVRPFEMLTEMFALPSYKEIDPTSILSLVFPFFFGLMIGDLGYGALLILTGAAFRWKLKKWEGFAEIGWYIMVAGAGAALLGLFVVGEAFGLPFHAAPGAESAHEMSWFSLTGIDVPLHASVHKLESSGLGTLIVFSLVAGIVHLSLGNILGAVNAWRTSRRHAAGKVGWLFVVLGFGLLLLKVGDKNVLGMWLWNNLLWPLAPSLDTGVGILVPWASVAFLLAGVALAVAGEGGLALLEVLGSLSNLLSYTRLAAIGVAKAAMAFAFNSMLIPLVTGGDPLWMVVGWVFLVLAHFLVFVLGALSSGIQALRLNFVEFFMKFYKGGGIKFKPFGYVRRNTTEGV
jgi:V/A-type H+-transporting ATPase subunit I